MTFDIKESSAYDSRIHNFIQDMVKEDGYMVVSMSWEVKVERMRNDVYDKYNCRKEDGGK